MTLGFLPNYFKPIQLLKLVRLQSYGISTMAGRPRTLQTANVYLHAKPWTLEG